MRNITPLDCRRRCCYSCCCPECFFSNPSLSVRSSDHHAFPRTFIRKGWLRSASTGVKKLHSSVDGDFRERAEQHDFCRWRLQTLPMSVFVIRQKGRVPMPRRQRQLSVFPQWTQVRTRRLPPPAAAAPCALITPPFLSVF